MNNLTDTTTIHATSQTDSPCIHDLIKAQAVKSPNDIAIHFADEQVTYFELIERANRLAQYLRSLGVDTETLVGICLGRSIDMVVGILGTLIAGGVYVPIDPAYPQSRIALILEDAGARFIVTENTLLDVFPKTNAHLVCMDQKTAEIAAQPAESPKTNTLPEHLAYVIYTSGSTGTPKGVMISHASLANFVKIAQSALDVSQTDVCLHNASIAYALSVRQLMIPLASGASIVLASAEEAKDPLLLFENIKRQKVTLMDVVPSFWRACIKRLMDLPVEERQNLLSNDLRRIVSIGEPLHFDIPYDWRVKLGHSAKLVNIFGQTETTGVVAVYPIPLEASAQNTGIVPIGRSISGTRLYILDPDLQPVQPGEIGELCVSGPCLACGYWNRPELTAEKFIANPFDDGISKRLYRTGDLARFQEDGVIEFLGRGDQQVKIRGQRLELGEVEVVLHEFPGIEECVVVARGNSPEEKYLAAYVVSSRNMTDKELRKFMSSRVPDYMIPSVFLFLDALPHTPNGKVNRLALPEPALASKPDSVIETDQPRNDIEQRIAHAWKDLLNLKQVGIHDDFFALGGHSLLAVQLFARIERDLGMRLPITTLFHAGTIAQLSDIVLSQDKTIIHWDPVVPIRVQGSKPPFFGVHGHEGGVLFWISLLNFWPKDQPFYAIQAQGVDGIKPALRRIEDMATLYISEMRKTQPVGPYYLGGYSMGGEIALEMSQQLHRQGEQVKLLLMLDTKNPKRAIRMDLQSNVKEVVPVIEQQKSAQRTWWRQKIAWHFRNLFSLNLREKVAYIMHNLTYRTERLLVYSIANVYRILGKRLPDRILLNYLRKSHSQAIHSYFPTRYRGKITLFRSSTTLSAEPDDSPMGWAPLAGGGLEVFHFNATHNLLNVEFVSEVASQLIQCLSQAQKGNYD